MINSVPPITAAFLICGSTICLAEAIGESEEFVIELINEDRRVPPEICPAIERTTTSLGRPVTCEQLRPDIAWDLFRLQAVCN